MRMLRTAWLVAAAALLLGAMPAAASCMPPIPIAQALAQADSVFVGSVIGLANSNRTATLNVDEVWRGPDLPAHAVVHGGGEGDMFTGVDRTWEAEGTYLVFASIVDGQLTDNACSTTQPWSGELDALRPSDARPPGDPTDLDTSGGLPGTLLVVIGAFGAIGLVSLLVFRKAR